MAIYAIGDIQGCYTDLLRLLDFIKFDVTQDQVWFTGDLVNRGTQSLETLRLVKSLGTAAITVLGNHDLHLLAIVYAQKKMHKHDTLDAILNAHDRDELICWLRHQPLFYHAHGFSLLHAGVLPHWDFIKIQQLAREAEQVLQGNDYEEFFAQMYGDKDQHWSEELTGMQRIRFIVNVFTRIRYCTANGDLNFKHKGTLGTQPKHLYPWFSLPQRQSKDLKIVFGHWSTLGFYAGNNCYGIDTGALWGGQLTAVKLGVEVERISINCAGNLNHE